MASIPQRASSNSLADPVPAVDTDESGRTISSWEDVGGLQDETLSIFFKWLTILDYGVNR
jgi:hypothetical protein